MATTQPTTPADDLDMRALMNDTMTKLGVKAIPLTVPPPPAPEGEREAKPPINHKEQLIGACIGLVLLIIVSILWSRSSAPASESAAPSAAAPSAAPTTATGPTVVPDPTIIAYFDYHNPASSTVITPAGMLRVEGTAGDAWRLIALSNHRPSVWIAADDVPSRLAQADPLPDLAPRPTARPAAATATPEPPRCETEADIRFTTERDVLINGVPRGHVIGRSCFSQADADAQANTQEQIVLQKGRTP